MQTHDMITDCDHGKHLELKEEKKKRIVNPSPNYKIQDDDDDDC